MELNIEKIKYEMERLGWTAERLSRELGMVRTYTYKYLRPGANPTLSTIERFAKVFKLDPKDLIK